MRIEKLAARSSRCQEYPFPASQPARAPYPRFGLVLMVNHACNLRCSYCYTGAKFGRPMPEEVGRKCIDRAARSVVPRGALELGFFGGEPLLEADLISNLIQYARGRTERDSLRLVLGLTTNGTVTNPAAWSLMTDSDLDLAISHDGLPEIHDRHRMDVHGRATSDRVFQTIHRMRDARKEFRVVMVVRPDTVEHFPQGIEFLMSQGVSYVEPSLDLWARWTREDAARLEIALRQCAQIWKNSFPHFGLSWFDEKAASLARLPSEPSARCGFGNGEIAVAPSGRLYPCERLIGEDSDSNPMRLPGHAFEGQDFLGLTSLSGETCESCSPCLLKSLCSTSCRCSNYVRTGDPNRPDGLLCFLNQVCTREVSLALASLTATFPPRKEASHE